MDKAPPICAGQVLLVLLLAALSTVVQIAAIHALVPMGPGFEAVSISRSLAEKGTFSDPFERPTGPTAHAPPLYPAVLAALRLITPDTHYFQFAALGLAVVVQAVHVLLVFLLARELFGERVGNLSLGLLLLVPLYQVMPSWETMWVAAAVAGFWLLARRRRVMFSGILAGLLLLMNPSALLIVLPIVVYEWRQPKPVAVLLLLIGILIAPWEVRNYRVFHKVFFIRNNLGTELDLYNNDCQVRDGTPCVPHPTLSEEQRQAVRDAGEIRYNQERMDRALEWMKTHPGDLVRLTARHALNFWLPFRGAQPFGWCITLLTAASVWGFFRMVKDRNPLVWPMLSICAIYPALYYLTYLDLRYRDPILFLCALATAYGISFFFRQAVRTGR